MGNMCTVSELERQFVRYYLYHEATCTTPPTVLLMPGRLKEGECEGRNGMEGVQILLLGAKGTSVVGLLQ